jgi:hypothetical protein
MDLTRSMATEEGQRLQEANQGKAAWKRWGPYVSERAWGTVREDYSAKGTAWEYFPHDHARSRTYRWSEDGLAGISDEHQHVCFALALWNGRDPILKERAFGLTNSEGNHGEDVKEYYFYLDSTPTHSYMKYLYRYPQAEFPYAKLVEENRRRNKAQPQFKLIDTGVFDGNRFFDVFVEYAKASPEDVLIEITVINHAAETASLDLLPTIWFRNRWSWDRDAERPEMKAGAAGRDWVSIEVCDAGDDRRRLYAETPAQLLFTENETNAKRVFGGVNRTPFVKDAFHDFVVHGRVEAVNPALTGTKAAPLYRVTLPAGESRRLRLRLTKEHFAKTAQPLGPDFERALARRREEADAFYQTIIPQKLDPDARHVARLAFAGLLWSKQYYHYEVRRWLDGDPTQPAPPPERRRGRNHRWKHLHNANIVSMPDKWEFPWYASWDLAFHCVVLATVDSTFAKGQLRLLLREWYMHPNGQVPAYEWSFDDVNPPVHAWAALRVYQIERRRTGKGDRAFLEAVFHKLLLNFNWWVNRKDVEGDNLFEGGFLGLDNIGIFDRNAPLPPGYIMGQSDGTSWMAMYCLNMLNIALELAAEDEVYEDVGVKFWEHFLFIADAMYRRGDEGMSLWDEQDGFFYDVMRLPSGEQRPIEVRSLVGLIPLLATAAVDYRVIDRFPAFKQRMEWFLQNRPEMAGNVAIMHDTRRPDRALLSVVKPEQLQRVLRIMLDESEFLSPYGIRSVSRVHKDHPYQLDLAGVSYSLTYEPGESVSGLFGGNSNWRGPVWMPMNYLLIEALQRFGYYFGDSYLVECPTGSGRMMSLDQVTVELSRRLVSIFLRDGNGRRAVLGEREILQTDPLWNDYVPFHEFFHGDSGAGMGAAHQTGWTALVAKLLQQSGSHFASAEGSGLLSVQGRARPKAKPAPAKKTGAAKPKGR